MQSISIDRKNEYKFGPSIREHLVESVQNVFDMRVRADSSTLNRMSFTCRSPSSGLLCSPKAYVEFELDIKSHMPTSTYTQSLAGTGPNYDAAERVQGEFEDGEDTAFGVTPLYCFVELDAVGGCLEHSSITINGSAITYPNPKLWWKSFLRCSIDDEQAQQIYSGCGGCADRYDCVPGKHMGVVTVEIDGTADSRVVGATVSGDSGVWQRARNLVCQTVRLTDGVSDDTGGEGEDFVPSLAINRGTRRIRVRWPVMGGLFSPLHGCKLNIQNPYFGQAYGLANQNQLSFDFLFSNLAQYCVRDLTSPSGADVYGQGGLQPDVVDAANDTITLVPDSTFLYLRYFRLAASREIPASQRVHTWKTLLSLGPAMPSNAIEPAITAMDSLEETLKVFEDGKLTYFPASGRDYQDVNGREVAVSGDYYEVTFENIAFPMPPHAIMICAQQDVGAFRHQKSDECARSVQNRDCNMSIEAIELTVNTSEKVIFYSADASNLTDKRNLFRSTSRNCGRDERQFFKGDINAWSDRSCVVYLTSDEWLPLNISPGMLVPITISCKVKFKNRNVYLDGVNPTNDGNLQMADIRMRSQPCLCAFYQRAVATLAPASCTLGTQSVSMHTGSEILAENR